MCDYQGVEFNTTADTEAEVNEPDPYLCKAGGTINASDNRLQNEHPDEAPMEMDPDPNGVVLLVDGNVDTTSTEAAVVTRLRTNGVPLVSPVPVSEVDTDRLGMMRTPSNPGVGAFVLVP